MKMKKKIKNLFLCGMMVCALMFGCFPDMALAGEKGIVVSNVTSNSATFDWTSWANEHDYLSYRWSIMSEDELAGKDPYNVESYYDGVFTSETVFLAEYCEENTKYYVCVTGSYFDWSEMEDFSEGKEAPQAVFAEFTTSGTKTAVKLNKKNITLTVGKKATIKLNGVAVSKQSFKSSNKKIAKVSSKGVVTAVKKGTCKITVTDEKTKKTYTCTVTVKNKDFFSKKGLKLTKLGKAKVTLAKGDSASGTLTNSTMKATVKVSCTQSKAKNGMVTDTYKIVVPNIGKSFTYNVSAFDRYTGTSFESKASNLDNGSVSQKGVVFKANGKKNVCVISADAKMDSKGNTTITFKIKHNEDYDGAILEFGAMTKKQYDKYHNKVNFKSQFTIADYSDVFITGQTFFSALEK